MSNKHKPVRRYEAVDPNPTAAAVNFRKPPTLAEQIARYMGDHERWKSQQGFETPEEADDLEVSDDDAPESPHELVYDEQLNREMPRYEKMLLDRQRAAFEEKLAQKLNADKAARAAADEAERRLKSERKKSTKKVDQDPGEGSED